MKYQFEGSITIKNGGIEVSDIVNNYRESRFYIGYTVKDALRLFKLEMGGI
jgi:hypothetical protein